MKQYRNITMYGVKKLLRQIRKFHRLNDPEIAHSREDELFQKVLKAIANGVDNPQELAKEALKSTKLDFPRWCS